MHNSNKATIIVIIIINLTHCEQGAHLAIHLAIQYTLGNISEYSQCLLVSLYIYIYMHDVDIPLTTSIYMYTTCIGLHVH